MFRHGLEHRSQTFLFIWALCNISVGQWAMLHCVQKNITTRIFLHRKMCRFAQKFVRNVLSELCIPLISNFNIHCYLKHNIFVIFVRLYCCRDGEQLMLQQLLEFQWGFGPRRSLYLSPSTGQIDVLSQFLLLACYIPDEAWRDIKQL